MAQSAGRRSRRRRRWGRWPCRSCGATGIRARFQRGHWRLAARFADELNLDGPEVDQIRDWLPIIEDRCEEVDRDPATLALSAEIWWHDATGQTRVERLQEVAELGLTRIHSHLRDAADSDEPLISFAEDCRAAGLDLEPLS